MCPTEGEYLRNYSVFWLRAKKISLSATKDSRDAEGRVIYEASVRCKAVDLTFLLPGMESLKGMA